MVLFDSHAHYDDKRFDEEFEGGSERAIALSFEKGICGIINVSTNLENAKTTIALSEKYDRIYAAVGYHPEDAGYLDEREIDAALEKCEALLSRKKVVAVGEIGLDYHYDASDETKKRQKYFFERQLECAASHSLPAIVHDRDAHGDSLEIVKRCVKKSGVTGVFHSFSGSAETARELLSLGWYISFGGPVSYKNAASVKRAAASVPLDRILIETDAPYLPPVPHRGEINYSAYMFDTLKALSDAMGYDEETVAAATVENTKRLFGV